VSVAALYTLPIYNSQPPLTQSRHEKILGGGPEWCPKYDVTENERKKRDLRDAKKGLFNTR
jgi:hypothetical protein